MSSSTDRRPDDAGVPDGARRLRLLQLASLVSTCDRFAIAPLLVPIAAELASRSPRPPRWRAATSSPTG